MTARFLALALLPHIAMACAPVERPTDTNPAVGAPAVKVKGPGQDCISRSQIRSTLVRSDRVIDFEMTNGDVYRSTLPNACPGLGFDRAITFETSIDQLCQQQIAYSLRNFGGVLERGAGCGLGEFVPVEYAKKAR